MTQERGYIYHYGDKVGYEGRTTKDELEVLKKLGGDDIFVILLDSINAEKLDACRYASEKGLRMFCAMHSALEENEYQSVARLRWTAIFYYEDKSQLAAIKIMIDAAVAAYQDVQNKRAEVRRKHQ